MSNPFSDALNVAPRDTWLDEYAYASLKAAEAKFYPRVEPALLAVDLSIDAVDAHDMARVSMALQSATAKIGRLLTDPKTQTTQARKSYREMAPLIPRGQSGSRLYFGFPDRFGEVANAEEMIDPQRQTLAERAAWNLLQILPSEQGDDLAMNAILARHVTERSAISDLVSAVESVHAGIRLTMASGSDVEAASMLSQDQASTLTDVLAAAEEVKSTSTFEGILDGMRTSRRLFYLEIASGTDISGAVDADMLETVHAHIGKRVIATVETTHKILKSGRHGRPSHRLLDLQRHTDLFDS